MKVFIGADHRGLKMKERVKSWLLSERYDVTDCGNTAYEKDDDFPDFSFAVADSVAKTPESRGIVICGTGGGVAIAANKVAGIRCTTGSIPAEVRHNRAHDNINILALSADYLSDDEAIDLVRVFLNTSFLAEERLLRRLKKIEERER
jgi:ribose 5-phosphate isomerase B